MANRQQSPVPPEEVAALRRVLFKDAWRCLQGCRAARARNPLGLLKYQIRQQVETTPGTLALQPPPPLATQPALPELRPTHAAAPLAVESFQPHAPEGPPQQMPTATSAVSPRGEPDPAAKRARVAAAATSEAWRPGDEPPPRHCCPGCGEFVAVGSRGFFTRDGIYEIMWRRRSCGASLTLCNVPVGFGSGGQLNMWFPHTQRLQPLQEGTHGGPARAHCGRRLNGNVCQTMLGTADPTSRAGQQLDCCIRGATSISACSTGCHCWGLQPARVERSHPWKCPSWQCCPYSRIRVGCAHSRAASCQLGAAMVSCMWHWYASVLQVLLDDRRPPRLGAWPTGLRGLMDVVTDATAIWQWSGVQHVVCPRLRLRPVAASATAALPSTCTRQPVAWSVLLDVPHIVGRGVLQHDRHARSVAFAAKVQPMRGFGDGRNAGHAAAPKCQSRGSGAIGVGSYGRCVR